MNRKAFVDRLDSVIAAVREHVLAKNDAYGDSALNPVRVFSRAGATEGLRVRIDDKLSRLARGDEDAFGERPVLDLIGYLVLLEMAEAPTLDPRTDVSGTVHCATQNRHEGHRWQDTSEPHTFWYCPGA